MISSSNVLFKIKSLSCARLALGAVLTRHQRERASEVEDLITFDCRLYLTDSTILGNHSESDHVVLLIVTETSSFSSRPHVNPAPPAAYCQ